jgi:molecular chaperone GrpE
MADSSSGPRGFTFVDRRASSMDDETIAETDAGAPAATKLAYVEQLERALAEKDRKLHEIAAEVGAVQERTRREAGREIERNRRALLVDLLEVVDGLDRALDAEGAAGADGGRSVSEGVGLVRDLLLRKLAGYGAARVEALGARFDPARHEAQALIPVDEAALDGVVVKVFREGYAVGGDVLRPAGVAVGRAG